MDYVNPISVLRILIVPSALFVLALVAGPQLRAEEASLRAFEAVELPSTIGRASSRMQIQAFGRNFQLKLSTNQTLLASLPTRQRSRIDVADRFLKGMIEGIPGSWVRLNRIDGRFSGGFFDGRELYLVDRAGGFPALRAAKLPGDQSIVFRFADLEFNALIDHGGVKPAGTSSAGAESAPYESFIKHLREIVTLEGTAMFAVPLTIVSDTQFTDRHPSSAASVVAGRINFIDGIFASQLGTGFTLLHHEILTDNDVLTATDAGDLLVGRFEDPDPNDGIEENFLVQPGFRQFMSSGAGSKLPFEGLAHLFTGRDLNGSTVGIAFLGVLCSRSAGYGVDQNLDSDIISALVFAHEVGHNFNAPHDGQDGEGQQGACADETFRGIMNPSINQSQQFSDCSLEQMAPAVAGASCLVEPIDSQVVFDDSFE